MRSESIKGIITYKEKEYPFLYENNKLSVFSSDQMAMVNAFQSFIDALNSHFTKNDDRKFVEHAYLHGKTNSGRNVIIQVLDKPTNDNGFLVFDVDSCYVFDDTRLVYSKGKDGTKNPPKRMQNIIQGIRILGNEIDYYFEADKTFSSTASYNKETADMESIRIEAKREELIDCGKFYIDDIEVTVKGTRYVSYMRGSLQPLIAKGCLFLEFSKQVDISFIENLIFALYRCLVFLCNRKTIHFEEIRTFSLTEDNKRYYFGDYTYNDSSEYEETSKLIERIIPVSYIKEKFSTLLQAFIDPGVYIAHIPRSYTKWNTYEHDRIIFDCVAFEKEFATQFPETVIRSQAFLEAKEEILKCVDQLIASYSGEKKKKAKSLKRSIEKIDNSLEERIKRAIKDHMGIMDIFISREYRENSDQIVEDCASRINDLRNAYAHGNMDYEITPYHLSDLKIIEILFYAMRLRSIGIDDNTIQKAICQLKDYNIEV